VPPKKPPQKPTAPPPKPTTFSLIDLPAPRLDLEHPEPTQKRYKLLFHPDLSTASPQTYVGLPSLLAPIPLGTFTTARHLALYWAKLAGIPCYQHAPGTNTYTLLWAPPPPSP
jgi:hypothetical protein